MILLTPQIHARLLANGLKPDVDHAPVVKLFNPVGAATWLASELDEDRDTLFGLADLGFGCPELGSFSLSEITSVRLPFGLGIDGTSCSKANSRCRSTRRPRGSPAPSSSPNGCFGKPPSGGRRCDALPAGGLDLSPGGGGQKE